MTPGGSSPSPNSGPPPPLVFNLTDLQGDSVDKNVTAPPMNKTSNHQDPLVFNLNDTQGDSVDKNETMPSLDTLLNFNSSTKTKIKESSNELEMQGPEMEDVPLGVDSHKSFMETEVDTLSDGDEDDVESEFYEDDLKNHGVNVDMFKSEENDEFLLPQRVKSASEESFDKQMGKVELRKIFLVGKNSFFQNL